MNVADHIRTCRADEPSRRRLLDEGFIEDVWAKKKEAVCRCSPSFNEYFKLIVIRMTCRIVQAVEVHERRASQFGLFEGSGSKKQFLLFLLAPFIIVIVAARSVFVVAAVRFSANSPPLLLDPDRSHFSSIVESLLYLQESVWPPSSLPASLFFPFHRPPFLRGGIGRLYFPCHWKWKHTFGHWKKMIVILQFSTQITYSVLYHSTY